MQETSATFNAAQSQFLQLSHKIFIMLKFNFLFMLLLSENKTIKHLQFPSDDSFFWAKAEQKVFLDINHFCYDFLINWGE